MDSITSDKDNNELKEIQVSRQDKVFLTQNLQTVTLENIFQELKTSTKLEQLIAKLRSIPEEDIQQEFKRDNLPYFNLGLFNKAHRKDVNLASTSFFIFDFDHLDDKLNDMMSNLKEDDSVFAFFVSPRGNGLKVIYRLDKPITNHKAYSKLYKYYAKIYKVDLGADPDKTSDASRACFFSFDPYMYLNNYAVPLKTEVSIIDDGNGQKVSSKKRSELISNLSGTTAGNRTSTAIQLLGNFIAKGVDKQISLEILQMWNQHNTPPLPVDKIAYTVNDLYERYEEKEKYLPVKFVERNNSYVKTIKHGKDFVQTMVTSFKIVPKELLVLENSDCLVCDIISSQGNHYKNVLIENTDWLTKQKFLKALGHQDCVFLGSDNDLQALCQFTQLNIPLRKTGTKVIGLHNDVWVLDGINISKEGKTKDLQIIPYDKGSDAFYHRIKYKDLTKNEFQMMIGTFYENILSINERNKMLAVVGWVFVTPVKPKIEEEMEAFPLLFLHGGQGSGKTSLAKLFARLVGYSDPNPNSVTLKYFPMLKMLSSTNAIPQWYDEFKVSDMKEVEVDNALRFMRKSYAGEMESKGRADQTIENYKLSAPMALLGEWNINQPAIMERVLLFRANDIIKKDSDMQKAFSILNELQLEGFMPEYIQYCLNQNIADLFKTAKSFVKGHFKNIIVAPRIVNNLSVMLVGLDLFRGFAHHNKLTVPDINYEELLDEQLEEITGAKNGMVRSAVDQLIEELSIMAEKNEISQMEDYKITNIKAGITVLAIKFKKVFRDFKVFAKKTQYEGDLLDETSYSKLFDDCDYVYSKDWSVKIGGKSQRCLCIDVEKAIQAGINLDGFGYNELHSVTNEMQPVMLEI